MSKQPNILLLHWHDLGRCLGCYGRAGVESPHLNRFVEQGVRFDQAFCTSPLCSPARGAIFTGRYPHSNGLLGLIPQGWRYHPDERTLPMLLREHGYHTALVGQQHESLRPQTLGFQTMRLVDWWPMCDLVTPMAVEFLEREARTSQPFFASIGFFDVHRLGADHYPPDRYPPVDMEAIDVPPFLDDNAETRQDLATFYGAIRVADAAVGRVLDTLEATGLADNTWVIFTTDHGMAFPGAKSTLYDPGIEVALMMRWPGGFAGGHHLTHPVSHVDLLPTVLEAVGGEAPESVQGQSFWPMLRDPATTPARDTVFAERNYHGADYDPIRCVRTSTHKYIRNFEPGTPPPMPGDVRSSPSAHRLPARLTQPRPAEELYDLNADPWETANLIGQTDVEHVHRKLARRLENWMQATNDPLLDGPVPTADEFRSLTPLS